MSKLNNKTEVKESLNKINISSIKTQNGYWELTKKDGKVDLELHNDGNISTIYNLNNLKDRAHFYFDDIPIDINTVGTIVENKNTIAFINVSFESNETFNILKKIKKVLGKPDQVINDKVFYNIKQNQVKLILKNFDSNEVNLDKDEFEDEYLFYPLHYIWNVNGYIYKYTLIINENSFNNDFIIISNTAFNEKLIFGYHNPQEDPLLKKYYNE